MILSAVRNSVVPLIFKNFFLLKTDVEMHKGYTSNLSQIIKMILFKDKNMKRKYFEMVRKHATL